MGRFIFLNTPQPWLISGPVSKVRWSSILESNACKDFRVGQHLRSLIGSSPHDDQSRTVVFFVCSKILSRRPRIVFWIPVQNWWVEKKMEAAPPSNAGSMELSSMFSHVLIGLKGRFPEWPVRSAEEKSKTMQVHAGKLMMLKRKSAIETLSNAETMIHRAPFVENGPGEFHFHSSWQQSLTSAIFYWTFVFFLR